MKEVHEDFSSYGERIDKLKSLERELKILDPHGFAVEEKIIKSKLKDPTAIPELEKRLSKLKKKMLGKHKKKSPVVKIGKNVDELTNVEIPKLHSEIKTLKKVLDEKENEDEKRKNVDAGVGVLVEDRYQNFISSLKHDLSEKEKKEEEILKEKIKKELIEKERLLNLDYDKKVLKLKEDYEKKIQLHLEDEVRRKFNQELQKKLGAEISKLIGRELSEDAFVLVNLGRLYATKGLGYLIEAISNLETSFPSKKIVLVIFGDGPEREALKLQVTSYKLQDKVFLVGDVADAAKYLPAFDALILSSVKEGLPYLILEAGLAGIPVISTNVGGVGEIIKDGENGILIEPKNPQAIADAVKNIINDGDKAKKLSAKLKKSVAEDFSFKEMAERTEWVYKI